MSRPEVCSRIQEEENTFFYAPQWLKSIKKHPESFAPLLFHSSLSSVQQLGTAKSLNRCGCHGTSEEDVWIGHGVVESGGGRYLGGSHLLHSGW